MQKLLAPGPPGLSNIVTNNHHHHHHSPVIEDVRHYWGQYSPYFNSTSSIPYETPHGCEITFVQVLSRHGSRFPTKHKSQAYKDLFERFLPHVPSSALTGPYEFLANYTYDLGHDVLVLPGMLEMAELGLEVYTRYSSLINNNTTSIPFFRASGSNRVIKSAELFSQSLRQARLEDLPTDTDPSSIPISPLLVIPEDPRINNTLDRAGCTNMHQSPYSKISKHAQKAFADQHILPLTDRLNRDLRLRGEHKLSIKDTTYLLDVCAFDTVATLHPYPPSNRTADGAGLSPLCALFSDADFRAYDYYQTLGKFYGYGHGNPLGPSIGVGFVNELIARLTSYPVRDHTSTNRTLDADPMSFPLGRQDDGRYARVFADFTHDNTIAAVHAALGLFDTRGLLPTTEIVSEEQAGGLSAAATVPFGARTVVEKMNCKRKREEHVRIVVNGRVMPLEMCGGDKLGRCSLSRFLKGLEFARSGGKYYKCFV